MPYRVTPRLSIGPAAIRRVDANPYLERLKATQAVGSSATEQIQNAALVRRQQAAVEAEQQRQAQLAQAQQQVKDRISASQLRTQELRTQAAQKQAATLEKQNARLAKTNQRLGAAQNYVNPNFSPTNDHLFPTGGAASKKAAEIINEALKYRGRMYQWGGSNPQTSFDCSGLVQWAYKSVGVGLPRVSADQARSGRKIPLQALRPGDLVAWDNSSRNMGADHIAIYIGNGQIIEAPRTGVAIRVRALGNEQNAWGVQILR